MNICPICGRQAAETDMVQVYGQVMCKTCAAEKNSDAFRNPSQKSKQQVAESAPPNTDDGRCPVSHTAENDLNRCLKKEKTAQKLQSVAKVIDIFGMITSIIIVVFIGLLGSLLIYSNIFTTLSYIESNNLLMSFKNLGATGLAIANFAICIFAALVNYYIFYILSLLLEAIASNLQYKKDISRLIEHQIRMNQTLR